MSPRLFLRHPRKSIEHLTEMSTPVDLNNRPSLPCAASISLNSKVIITNQHYFEQQLISCPITDRVAIFIDVGSNCGCSCNSSGQESRRDHRRYRTQSKRCCRCRWTKRTASILTMGSNSFVVEECEQSLHDALCVVRCLVKKAVRLLVLTCIGMNLNVFNSNAEH